MSRIFLSHSSANNAEAVALRDWLNREGWNDVFLDIDPDRGIAAGERWERALNEAANRCEAVLFVVSRAWLASGWCLKEFNLAHRLNKRLFGLLVDDLAPADLPVNLTSTWQLVRLSAGRDHVMLRVTMPFTGEEAHVTFSAEALARLKTGLQRAGLDSRFFAWPPDSDPNRPPYRGLRPLEAEDAGIFFGRDAPIVEALDRLRGLRDAAPPRLLVILGASGAGKSSFLRAGLVPRIRRDDQNFTLLPVLRPDRAAINGETGLVRALETAMQAQSLVQARADIKTAISGGAPTLLPLLAKLADKARPPRLPGEPEGKPPSVVLPIDQGEELFLAEGATEAEPLLALMRDLLTADAPGVIVIFIMRSDSYERLQTAKALDGISQQTLSLSPLPKGAYQTVIEGPTERLKDGPRALKIEPALTQALLADIEAGGGRDALPLLAFTMERLYLEYGGRGRLTLADYEALGRIKGSIEAAVERAMAAADADPKIPRDRAARLTLLRRGFIPWLAGIDSETGSPRRRVARMSEIPAEARPLVDLLVAEHLLATDVEQDTGEVTIEPAHEALLRQWGLLQGWLEEDFGALTTLAGVQRAARDWAANNKDVGWLTHAAGRLEEAERLKARDDFARLIAPTERDYLAQCRQREDTERSAEQMRLARERRNLRRVRWALTAFFVVVMAALSGALWQSYQTSKREAAVFASTSASASEQGFCDRALRLAVAGLPPSQGSSPLTFRSDELEGDLSGFASANNCWFKLALSKHTSSVRGAAFSPDGTRVVTASNDNTARIWDAKTGASLVTLVGHTDVVVSAAFSPDGTRILTASNDNTARVWDAKTGASLVTLVGHTDVVVSAAFSPDGTRVLTASMDHSARIWDAKTGAALAMLSGHTDVMNSAVFSSDGSRVATASWDNTARIWDAKTGAALATLAGHTNWVMSAAFSPDGSRIVTASVDNTARIWDAKTGAALVTLSGHTAVVTSAMFSLDGNRVVTTSWDRTARLWDVKTGAALATFSGHTDHVNSAVFSPDGNRVVTASLDHTARLWDAKTGAALATFVGHTKGVNGALFSPRGRRIVTASSDETARLWNAATGAALTVLSGHTDPVRNAVFSPDGSRVATASDDHTARIWDSATGTALATLSRHAANVVTAVFSLDGNRIVTASVDKTARIWDAKTGAALVALLGDTNWVMSAAFSPEGSRIITASADDTARLWDAETGAALATFAGHTDRVNSAAFSPRGNRVVTASDDRTARIWDAKTGAVLATLSGHTGEVRDAVFSPDGNQVVTASMDHNARIWDAKTGAALATLSGHTSIVGTAEFSPDGKHVVTSSWDNTARIWDTKTGAALVTLLGHRNIVVSASFSPDGRRIVTASSDNTARIWDAKTGAALATLSGHTDSLNSAVFSPDGSRVVTASNDNTARIWLLDPIILMEPGERRDYVCRERLIGAQSFMDEEMQDPILRGRDDLRNPCARVGPLSFEYYVNAASNLWSSIRGAAPRPAGN
jgi:WD40 repeat protein